MKTTISITVFFIISLIFTLAAALVHEAGKRSVSNVPQSLPETQIVEEVQPEPQSEPQTEPKLTWDEFTSKFGWILDADRLDDLYFPKSLRYDEHFEWKLSRKDECKHPNILAYLDELESTAREEVSKVKSVRDLSQDQLNLIYEESIKSQLNLDSYADKNKIIGRIVKNGEQQWFDNPIVPMYPPEFEYRSNGYTPYDIDWVRGGGVITIEIYIYK